MTKEEELEQLRDEKWSRLGAVGVYLVEQQLVPYERACEVIQDLLGPKMSVGTLQALVQRCAGQLEPMEQQIKAALSRSDVLHQDEAGLYVEGKRHWMAYSFFNERYLIESP